MYFERFISSHVFSKRTPSKQGCIDLVTVQNTHPAIMELSVGSKLNKKRNTISTYACIQSARRTKEPSEFRMIISISAVPNYARLSEFHHKYPGSRSPTLAPCTSDYGRYVPRHNGMADPTTPSPTQMPRPKRHKIDVACDTCRARKVKCDGIRPGMS